MKKDGLYEKVRKGLKRNTPKYDDELEELEKENLLCGSKENTQRNKLTMKEMNSLEDLLYGETNGKKTFSTFRKEGGELTERTKGKREKKINKLSNKKDHWKGLEHNEMDD